MTGQVSTGLVRVSDVRVHPRNVRRDLGDLRGMAESIRRLGVLQPLVVERHRDFLRLRAGHRRLAAAEIAGLTRVPAVIHGDVLSEERFLEVVIAENVHRAELTAQEKAQAVEDMHDIGYSYEQIADAFTVSVTTVRSWAERARRAERPVPLRRTAGGPRGDLFRQVTPGHTMSHAERGRRVRGLRTGVKGFIDRWEPAVDSDYGLDPAGLRQLLDELRALLDPDRKDADG